jgi:hypothetical protein
VPVPLDDDPLTSPSFPAINTSDSRSYRTSRPEAETGPGRSAAYSEPTQQFSAYPDQPARAVSAPNGYPVQPAAPAGNPYGSFVSQPAASFQQPPPAPAHQDPGYIAYSQPINGQSVHGQPNGTDGWYSAPANGGPHNQSAQAPSPATGDYPPGGGAGMNGYDHAAYQAMQPETAAYHQTAYPGIQYDQGGYAAQDAAYGRDAYQGYPGYGTGSY